MECGQSMNKNEFLGSEHRKLRKEWNAIRDKRLNIKCELILTGLNKNEIRKDRIYKKLKREQYRLSIRIKHLVKKINKSSANKQG